MFKIQTLIDYLVAAKANSLEPLHPPMHDDKAVSLAILMSNALGGPTADGIDDVGWAFNGTEAVT